MVHSFNCTFIRLLFGRPCVCVRERAGFAPRMFSCPHSQIDYGRKTPSARNTSARAVTLVLTSCCSRMSRAMRVGRGKTGQQSVIDLQATVTSGDVERDAHSCPRQLRQLVVEHPRTLLWTLDAPLVIL